MIILELSEIAPWIILTTEFVKAITGLIKICKSEYMKSKNE
jgi:hypothetical protein